MKTHSKSGARVSAGVAAALCTALAFASPTVYFGEDLLAGSPAGMANSFDAHDQFRAAITNVGVEDFESFAAGQTFPAAGQLDFAGSSTTAMLTGGLVRNDLFNGRFPVQGSNYLDTSFNQRITFSAAVSAFGLFVVDANELDNDPAAVTVNGQPLTQAQIDARPFRSVDGIFRIVTERAPGVFEVLFRGGTFPTGQGSAMFVGLVDAETPFSNIILVNGTSGLDAGFLDGFGYDQLIVGAAIPEPASAVLLLAAVVAACAGRWRQRSPSGACSRL